MRQPDWTQSAFAVKAVTVEIGFWISEFFEYSVLTSKKCKHKPHCDIHREPLYQPQLKKHKSRGDRSCVLTQAVQSPYYPASESSTEKLIRHYLDVDRLIQQHSTPGWHHYFWMSPVIFAQERFELDFPYHDTWKQTEEFLNQISVQNDGFLLQGRDQGWNVDIYATSDQVFLRQGIIQGDELNCVVCDRPSFTEQIRLVRERTHQIVMELCAAVGETYWMDS
ncbi:MAG: hypothetical protein VKL39_08820 [Leptolyngbyaceae bacterium]|nr:hypothetical protein [Leptolyngbyaceae bacterium]